jgi:hypothetical protein
MAAAIVARSDPVSCGRPAGATFNGDGLSVFRPDPAAAASTVLITRMYSRNGRIVYISPT